MNEHVHECIQLFRENDIEFTAEDVADQILDIVDPTELLYPGETESDLRKRLTNEAEYYLS